MSTSDYIEFIGRNDINHAMLLLVGAIVAYRMMRFKDKEYPLPTIPIWYILVLSFLIPLNRIINEPLWYDETFATITSSLTSFNDVMTVVQSDVHTPTHYTLLHIWISIFGNSQVAVRIPSLIAGVFSVFVSYELAKTFFNKNMASWSAVLVAMTPAVIHYSSEARYPIFLLLSILIALLAIRKQWSRSLPFLIAFPAWWHVTAIPYSLALLWYARKQLRPYQILLTICLSSVFVPLALSQSGDVINGFWLQLRFPLHHIIMNFGYRQNDLIILVIPFIGFFVVSGLKHHRYNLLIWGVPIAIWVVSAFFVPVYLFRTLTASVVIIVMLSVPLIYRRNTIVFVTLLFIFSLTMYFTGQKRIDFNQAFSHCEGQDYLVATSTGLTIIALYHSPLPAYSYGIDTNSQWLSNEAKQAMGFMRPPQDGKGCLVTYNNKETEPMEKLHTVNKQLVYSIQSGVFTELRVYYD